MPVGPFFIAIVKNKFTFFSPHFVNFCLSLYVMKYLFFSLFLAVAAFAKPLVVYTGVYSVSADKTLGDIKMFAPMFFDIFSSWQNANDLPFDLLMETDAEETKHLAADPISMAILVTRDDLQIEHFKKIKVTKTTVNLGISVLFYQTRITDKGAVNTILASIPLNSYMSNEKPLALNDNESKRSLMMEKIARELIQNRFKKRIRSISIDEIKVKVNCEESGCFVKKFKKDGLEVGQSVSLPYDNGRVDAFILSEDGALEIDDANALASFKQMSSFDGIASNLKGYSDETWQVVKVDITSKKAAELFKKEPIQAQIAQWYSDFLSGTGKAVLPPISGVKWTANSMGYTEMILARDDGEMSTFVMAPARHKVKLGFSGVASGAIKKNKVEELWAYKIWLTNKVGNQKEVEEEYTTSKKVVVETQEHREVDVFRDLLHVSTKKLAEKGE